MADIRVTTTVEIVDELGKPMASVTRTAAARPGGNPQFFATYTRGAIQQTEHSIAAMLIAEFGDKPA